MTYSEKLTQKSFMNIVNKKTATKLPFLLRMNLPMPIYRELLYQYNKSLNGKITQSGSRPSPKKPIFYSYLFLPAVTSIDNHFTFEITYLSLLLHKQMNQYDQQQKFLPRKLLQSDQREETKSIHSDNTMEKMMAFSAPPILFDIGARFYEDFIEEITQSDPQLDKYGLAKTFSKRNEVKSEMPQNGYRKFSLQNEDYHSYYAVHVPTPQYYSNLTPEEEILNNLDQAAKWARDQYGSRAVQSVISNGQSYAKNAVFESLIQESIELTKDKFGNYVFQKLFENGQDAHRHRLFQVIKNHVLQFSQNCYGCRVVQKAIEFTKDHPQLQQDIIKLIEPYSVYLIENINGNHVMQKCFEIIELPYLANCIKIVTDNYQKLSLHAYGCRVIQKYLEKLHTQIIQRQDLIRKESNQKRLETLQSELAYIKELEKTMFEKLLAISVELSQCQYGNYVMQHIVSNSKEYKGRVEEIFLNNFILLSINKYASNVIEKVIKLASADYRQRLAKCLCESESLVGLAKHQYGNYVIQSLIQKISAQSRLSLKTRIKENSQEISKSQYGRHVLMQLEKIK